MFPKAFLTLQSSGPDHTIIVDCLLKPEREKPREQVTKPFTVEPILFFWLVRTTSNETSTESFGVAAFVQRVARAPETHPRHELQSERARQGFLKCSGLKAVKGFTVAHSKGRDAQLTGVMFWGKT